MCNYNAGDRVAKSTDALNRFIESNQMELHFIDNASRDRSYENVKCKCKQKILLDHNIGKAAAINHLVSLAEIPDDGIILLIDSDIEVIPNDFASKLEEAWKRCKGQVSAIICMQSGNSLHRRKLEFFNISPGISTFFPIEGYGHGIAGGAMSVISSAFKSVGGFNMKTGANGNPSIYGSNDGLLMLSLWNKLQKPVCVIKELEVYHPPEPDSNYQKWKDGVHQEHAKFGHAVTDKGFYS